MKRRQSKISKRNLIDRAHSDLNDEFGPTNISSTTEDNKVNYPEETPNLKNQNMSNPVSADISQIGEEKVERVSIFTKLPNGLTPYELMYGKIDDDSILPTYMRMS